MTTQFAPYAMIGVINLPSRKDRRREMVRNLARLGIDRDPRVFFFDAVRPADRGRFSSVGAHGCFLSHLGLLRMAAANDASILILEDDCEFEPGAQGYKVPPGTALFYGGGTLTDPARPLESDVIGSHCMGFSAEAAKSAAAFFAAMLAPGFQPDATIAPPGSYDGNTLAPVDGAYIWFRRGHGALHVHLALPPIALQRPSSSDIAPQRWDRIWGATPALNALRTLRTRLRRSS